MMILGTILKWYYLVCNQLKTVRKFSLPVYLQLRMSNCLLDTSWLSDQGISGLFCPWNEPSSNGPKSKINKMKNIFNAKLFLNNLIPGFSMFELGIFMGQPTLITLTEFGVLGTLFLRHLRWQSCQRKGKKVQYSV